MGHSKRGHFGGVCAKSVPSRGGGTSVLFLCVCVPSPRVPSQKTDGGTELIQFQNGERTSKLYLSKPTWYERQTFYARTARATLINFGAKVIVNCVWIYVSGVSEFTWSKRQDDYNMISVSPSKIDIKPTLFLWIFLPIFQRTSHHFQKFFAFSPSRAV